jgi:hypothetical protein
VDGKLFASKKEAARYQELKYLTMLGIVKDLKLQPQYHIIVRGEHICDYRADFQYMEKDALVIEDVKGFKTNEYKLKKKLMHACYGIDIKET